MTKWLNWTELRRVQNIGLDIATKIIINIKSKSQYNFKWLSLFRVRAQTVIQTWQLKLSPPQYTWDFSSGANGEEPACQCRRHKRHGFIWSLSGRRSPGGGHGYPLQYSCLENPMGIGAWWTTLHGDAKSQTYTHRIYLGYFVFLSNSFKNYMLKMLYCSFTREKQQLVCNNHRTGRDRIWTQLSQLPKTMFTVSHRCSEDSSFSIVSKLFYVSFDCFEVFFGRLTIAWMDVNSMRAGRIFFWGGSVFSL